MDELTIDNVVDQLLQLINDTTLFDDDFEDKSYNLINCLLQQELKKVGQWKPIEDIPMTGFFELFSGWIENDNYIIKHGHPRQFPRHIFSYYREYTLPDHSRQVSHTWQEILKNRGMVEHKMQQTFGTEIYFVGQRVCRTTTNYEEVDNLISYGVGLKVVSSGAIGQELEIISLPNPTLAEE